MFSLSVTEIICLLGAAAGSAGYFWMGWHFASMSDDELLSRLVPNSEPTHHKLDIARAGARKYMMAAPVPFMLMLILVVTGVVADATGPVQ